MIANPNFFRRPRYGADAATLNMGGGGWGGGAPRQRQSWGAPAPASPQPNMPWNEQMKQLANAAMPQNTGAITAPVPVPAPAPVQAAPSWDTGAVRDVGATAMPANSGFVGSPSAQPVGVYAASPQPVPPPAWPEAATRDAGVSAMPPNSGTVSDQYTAPINAQPSLQNDPFALRRYWQQQANLRSGRVY